MPKLDVNAKNLRLLGSHCANVTNQLKATLGDQQASKYGSILPALSVIMVLDRVRQKEQAEGNDVSGLLPMAQSAVIMGLISAGTVDGPSMQEQVKSLLDMKELRAETSEKDQAEFDEQYKDQVEEIERVVTEMDLSSLDGGLPDYANNFLEYAGELAEQIAEQAEELRKDAEDVRTQSPIPTPQPSRGSGEEG